MPRLSKSAPPAHDDVDPTGKRRRKPLSCMECRRLKLRCDRKFPCESCQTRGCASICPTGSLTGGKGSRFILANTEELHDKISLLSGRIRELEAAVEELQALNSKLPHPLLAKELLLIKLPLEINRQYKDENGNITTTGGVALISQPNPRRQAALTGSDRVRRKSGESESDEDSNDSSLAHDDAMSDTSDGLLPPDIVQLAASFPFSPESTRVGTPATGEHSPAHNPTESTGGYSTTTLQLPSVPPMPRSHHLGINASLSHRDTADTSHYALIYSASTRFLPPASDAVAMVAVFFERFAWLYTAVSKAAVDILLSEIYRSAHDQLHPGALSSPSTGSHSLSPSVLASSSQRAAIIYSIFALASVMDARSPVLSLEGEMYHTISRAAVGAALAADDESAQTCLALFLVAAFFETSDKPTARRDSANTMGVLVKMAQRLSLHSHSSTWQVDQQEARSRMNLFWSIFTLDAIQAFALGRSGSFVGAQVDCEIDIYLPYAVPEEVAFLQWQRKFARIYLPQVVNVAFNSSALAYPATLDLDRAICSENFPLLPIRRDSSASVSSISGAQTNGLRRFVAIMTKESALLHLHRRWFVVALTENPQDPLQSGYSQSITAAYSSSCAIVSAMCSAYEEDARLLSRLIHYWSDLLPACLILSLLVSTSPISEFAHSALNQLDAACALLQRISDEIRPSDLLPSVLHLRNCAYAATDAARNGVPSIHPTADGAFLSSQDALKVLTQRRVSLTQAISLTHRRASEQQAARLSISSLSSAQSLATPTERNFATFSPAGDASLRSAQALGPLAQTHAHLAAGHAHSPLSSAHLPRALYLYPEPGTSSLATMRPEPGYSPFSSDAVFPLPQAYENPTSDMYINPGFSFPPQRPISGRALSYMSELGCWDSPTQA